MQQTTTTQQTQDALAPDDGAGLLAGWNGPEEEPGEADAPGGAEERRMLRFRARVDRESRDVELPEDELPAVYQKAQVADRWREQRDRYAAQYGKTETLARSMGYGSADELLSAAERALPGAGAAPPVRDYQGEALAFFTARPELAGKELPQGVLRRWAAGEPLEAAYAGEEAGLRARETERLRRENLALRQNADAGSRAPVRGVSADGPVGREPEDPFLAGLNYEYGKD